MNGALVPTVRGRIAVRYNRDDGWQKNLTLGTRFAATDVLSGRLLLDFDLGSNASLLLNIHGTRQRNSSEGFAVLGKLDPVTGLPCTSDRILAGQCATAFGFVHGAPDPTRVFSDTPKLRHDVDAVGGAATLKWALGAVDFTSITAFDKSDRLYQEDVDGPSPLGRADFSVDSEQFSQEIRFSGDSERFKWVIGAFYYNDKKMNLDVEAIQLVPLFGTFGLKNQAKLDTESWALFGQSEFKLNDALSLVGGLRYTDEVKHLVISDDFAAPLFTDREQAKASRVTWKAGINLHLSDDALAYASIATGFKSSAFNTVLVTPGLAAPVGQEKNVNYEIGLKTDLFDRLVRFNSAIFYNDYSDVQVISIQDIGGFPAAVFLNGGNIEFYGGEFELSAVPTAGLQLGFGGGFLHGKFTSPASVLLRGVPIDGKRPPHTPSVSLNGLVSYTFDLAASGNITLQANARYESKVFFETNNDPLTSRGPVFIMNGRIRWESDSSNYSVEVFADNILNKKLVFNAFDFSSFALVDRLWQPPRRFGIKAAVGF